jgi:hypothetical protein
MTEVMTHAPSRALIELLSGGQMKTDRLEAAAKSRRVARSTMFKTVGYLERLGVIERPNRGVIGLSEVAAAFATGTSGAGSVRPVPRRSRRGAA